MDALLDFRKEVTLDGETSPGEIEWLLANPTAWPSCAADGSRSTGNAWAEAWNQIEAIEQRAVTGSVVRRGHARRWQEPASPRWGRGHDALAGE